MQNIIQIPSIVTLQELQVCQNYWSLSVWAPTKTSIWALTTISIFLRTKSTIYQRVSAKLKSFLMRILMSKTITVACNVSHHSTPTSSQRPPEQEYYYIHSITNIFTNISSISTGVGSLDSSHWALFNSLFIDYFIPNIHGDMAAWRVGRHAKQPAETHGSVKRVAGRPDPENLQG